MAFPHSRFRYCFPTVPKVLLGWEGQEILQMTSTHATGSVHLSLLMLVSVSLQPQGKCMIHGMMTGRQAFMEIVTMTNTAAGLLWAGWPSCSGAGLGPGSGH